MANSTVTPPAGVHPDALPPDFDGWDKGPTVPDHPLGDIRAYDFDSGLPIVKRKGANDTRGNDVSAHSSQGGGVLGQEVPDQPSSAAGSAPESKAPEASGKGQEITKGAPVQLPDGTTGKVAHVVANMKTVRVRTDDGRNLTVRQSALKILPHVMVQTHARRINK